MCWSRHSLSIEGLSCHVKTARSGQSPSYGACTSSPKPIGHDTQNPPPLDLGEASVPDDSHMSKSPGANSEQDRIRKGVTFPALDTGAKPSSPRSMEGSRHRSSDEDALTSDSGRPLTSAGPSKSRPSPKIGKSPRFAPSPRTPGGITKSPSPKVGSSPQISRRSIRMSRQQCHQLTHQAL